MYRAINPRTWWWTPQVDFLAAILYSLQVANWQRGGGKGSKPKPVKRPTEVKAGRNLPKDRDELAARRQKLRDAQGHNRKRVSGGD